jgi:hypothetical protein
LGQCHGGESNGAAGGLEEFSSVHGLSRRISEKNGRRADVRRQDIVAEKDGFALACWRAVRHIESRPQLM